MVIFLLVVLVVALVAWLVLRWWPLFQRTGIVWYDRVEQLEDQSQQPQQRDHEEAQQPPQRDNDEAPPPYSRADDDIDEEELNDCVK